MKLAGETVKRMAVCQGIACQYVRFITESERPGASFNSLSALAAMSFWGQSSHPSLCEQAPSSSGGI